MLARVSGHACNGVPAVVARCGDVERRGGGGGGGVLVPLRVFPAVTRNRALAGRTA